MNLEPGTTLGEAGRFLIQRRLGAGGMGIVYQALDRLRNVQVALKTLPKIEPRALYRFKREFRLLADLADPNLASLHELIASGDQWFFTMELVDGVDFLSFVRAEDGARPPASGTDSEVDSAETRLSGLASPSPLVAVERNPLTPLSEFTRITSATRQLASALRTLHRAGRLHCDLKPSNVMVTSEGRVVVLDFGLALEFEVGTTSADTGGEWFGTVEYMAPEQASGGSLTAASDWYAVGTMLYEAIAGRLPFRGSMFDVLAAKRQSAPESPRRFNPAVPAALEQLCLQLLAPQPTDRPDAADVLRMLGGGTAAPVIVTEPAVVDLIGRERHLETLQHAFRASVAGRPIWLFAHGASGMGKSAVVDHFTDALQSRGQALVLAGRCYEQESVRYKALDSLVDALSRHLAHLSAEKVRALLPEDISLLAQMFPMLERVDEIHARANQRPLILSPQELRNRASVAFAQLLGALAGRQPLVLAIDDLQWGDSDSAGLLVDMFSGPHAPAVLLIGSHRAERAADSACLAALLRPDAPLACERRELAIGALDSADALRLALGLLGRDFPMAGAMAARIAEEAGGSPFFIRALVDHVQAESQLTGPGLLAEGTTLDEVLRRRFSRLRSGSRRLLDVIAVAARPIAEAEAYAAAGIDERDPALVNALRAAHMVRSTSGDVRELETYHDRVRQSVVAALAGPALTDTHRRLAETLDAKGTVDPEWLAAHYLGAGNHSSAASHFTRGAEIASRLLAFDRAADLYQRAIELSEDSGTDRFPLLVGRADALANAGRGQLAAETYQHAATLAPADEALELERKAGYQYCISGHLDEGRAVLARCMTRVGLRLPRSTRAALLPLAVRSARLWALERLGLLRRLSPQREVSAQALTRIDIVWAAAAALSDVDVVLGAALKAQHLLMARTLGEPGRLACSLALQATVVLQLGSKGHRRALALIETAQQLADQVGTPHTKAVVLVAQSFADLTTQSWRHAYESLDQAERLLRDHCTGVSWELSLVHVSRISMLRIEGQYAEAVRRGLAVLAEAQHRGDIFTQARIGIFVLVDQHLLADRFAEGRRVLRELSREWFRGRFPVQQVLGFIHDINIDLLMDRRGMAWRRCRRYWPLIERTQMLRVEVIRDYAILLHGSTALAAIDDDPGSSGPLLKVAKSDLRRLRREPGPRAGTFALMLQAMIALREGNRQEAIALIDRAASWFGGVGQQSFAAALRHCQGRLIGGAAGQTLMHESDRLFAAQGFTNPTTAVITHVPGFPRALTRP
jgi:eukaryotic-like serine/threonine-protein kinase